VASFFFSFFSFFPAGAAAGAGVSASATAAGFFSFFEGSAFRSAFGAFSRSNAIRSKEGLSAAAEGRTTVEDCMWSKKRVREGRA